MAGRYKAGDCVVYRKQKFSTHPGANATHIWASESGDGYSYCVDKFYRVISVETGDSIRIRTRKGKELVLRQDDISLRPARLWERLYYRSRFPAIAETTGAS